MRPSRARRRFLALGLLALGAVLSACRSDPSANSATPAAVPTNLRVAMISDPKTFNPLLVTDNGSLEALQPMFEGLVRLDPVSLEVEPVLAEKWEHDASGREWTFHLRRDVRWHDGTPFTAKDVVFTFATVFDDKVPNSSKHVLTIDGEPVRAAAVDDHTVRFNMARPFAPFLLAAGGIDILPEHRLGPERAAGRFAQAWGINTPPAEIVGTGPFKLAQYTPAQFLRYERNPDYWRRDTDGSPLPHLTERTTLIVPDQNTAFLKFLGREIDIHPPRPEEIVQLESQLQSLGIELEEMGLDSSSLFVTFNRNPAHYVRNGKTDPRLRWFTDKRFVRALAHAIDKESIVLNCLSGYGQPATAKISPADKLFHHAGLKDYGYDLDKARTLLSEAGFQWRDGALHDAEGNRVEFSLTTNAGNQVREKMCSILKQDWTNLGIQVNYRPLDFTTLVEKLDQTFDWDVMMMGFTATTEPHLSANLLRSSGNLHLWHPNQKQPATAWEAEIDALIEEGAHTLELSQRQRVYRRIQEILHEEMPMLDLVHSTRFVAFDRRLQPFERTVWGQRRPEALRFVP